MDQENQQRIKDLAEEHGRENLLVILGGAEAEASGLACETVANGDPTFAGPLAGVQLGLACYHVMEPEIKKSIDEDVYEEQISMMEMVLDKEDIIAEVKKYREEYSDYDLMSVGG
ncbi:Glycine reductase complex selenoprotein A [Halarsenatibacter silvermanii]|uniref:Glycine reductase complex selenoprotein A n=3 Tax=Halarsenatibacter silvermanii TaxID=321763 RepID=A0A1G9N3H7_9FIRM|nr:Glycine reductase complex selenoprotein A [Halarsenatibacter silvermanii]